MTEDLAAELTPPGGRAEAVDARAEPLTVYIVLEVEGGRDAVDGLHLDESVATKRCEELNFRHDDPNFACVVAKYIRTTSGYLTKGSAAQDVAER